MSLKIQQFTSVIANPMNVHNFQVHIPGFDDYSIIVQSTSFPQERMRQTNLYVAGEQIRYATVPQNGGTWNINVPEDDNGTISRIFQAKKAQLWDQETGMLAVSAADWENIRVVARDLEGTPSFDVTLMGCWIVGANDVNLNAQDPTTNWRWDYQFVYQWIKDSNLRG